MSILDNFVNPWESSGALGSQALGTEVLEYSVLVGEFNGISVQISNDAFKKAFKAFFNTPLGRQFIGHFAKKGQTVNGHTFSMNGKYYNKKIDLRYYDAPFPISKKRTGAVTLGGIKGGVIIDNRLKLEIKLNSTTTAYKSLLDKVIAITHESLLHVYEYTLDFIDNGKIDYSHDSFYKSISKIPPASKHHYLFHRKKNASTTHPLATQGLAILESVNKTYKMGYSRTQLWNELWDFGD